MSRTIRNLVLWALGGVVLALAFGAGLLLGPTRADDSKAGTATGPLRSISYTMGAPRDFPVIYQITLNGARISPMASGTVQWSGPNGFSDGATLAGSLPSYRGDRDRLLVQAAWIEWTTRQAYATELALDWPPERATLTLYFGPGGELSAYLPSDALLAGTLGRAATRDDYRRVAQVCADALDPASDTAAALADLARADQGVLPPAASDGSRPAPAPGPCSQN